MGIFTDQLNKLKASLASAPVPRLTVSNPSPYIAPKQSGPMVFKVGEGLTPEQTAIAQEKLRTPDVIGQKTPYSFRESLDLFLALALA